MSGTEQRRRRALRAAAPVAGLLAAGLLVWQGSYAAFSATTDNTGNAWSTGNLNLTNNGGGTTYGASTAALFTEPGVRPGSTNVKCITVQSTGTLASNLRLWRGAIGGTANAAGLAAALNVTVDSQNVGAAVNVQANCTGYTAGTSGAIYNGTLAGMPTTYSTANGTALTGTPTERIAYRISWTLPSSVTDNTLQGQTATTTFTWETQTP